MEVYGPPNIDVRIERVPEAPTRSLEASAEEWAYGRLPGRYKKLVDMWGPRQVGTTRTLTTSAMLASSSLRRDLKAIEDFAKVCRV